MKIPNNIYHIKGNNGGPNVMVLGGTHGDEVVGVEVVRKLLDFFGVKGESGKTYENEIISGNLYLGFGNPEAIKKGTRGAGVGPDLNRSFQIDELNTPASEDDRYDLVRARELFPLLENMDYLFDLHSTYTPSEPFICMGNYNSENQNLYNVVPSKYILADPDNVLPKDFNKKELGTTDYVVNTSGGSDWSVKKYGKRKGVAFAYESGSKEDLGKSDKVFETVLLLLGEISLLNNKRDLAENNKQEVYKLSKIIKANNTGKFSFYDEFKDGWVAVKKGNAIGFYSESNQKEIAPCEGRLLFQKEKDGFDKGESLCYLATLL